MTTCSVCPHENFGSKVSHNVSTGEGVPDVGDKEDIKCASLPPASIKRSITSRIAHNMTGDDSVSDVITCN